MKKTFDYLPEEKKQKILSACIQEFGEKGYEHSTLDRIVQQAGISKGGLYEYIESKDDLYFYIVGLTYDELYDFIEKQIAARGISLPPDIVDRMRLVAEIAVDFYISHPHYLEIIVGTYHLPRVDLSNKVRKLFMHRFLRLFGDADFSHIPHSQEEVLNFLIWMLLRTRYDFLVEYRANREANVVRNRYLAKWDFYVTILKKGLYSL
ncbi:MAG: TetR/AcrR family transcriptional regulator [Spirochaetales bacterium]